MPAAARDVARDQYDRVTHVRDLVRREQMIVLDNRAKDEWPLYIGRRRDTQHARRCPRGVKIERFDHTMRDGRTENFQVQLAPLRRMIVDEPIFR